MKNLIVENQNIIHGSSHLRGNNKFIKIDYMTSNMADNTAYKEYLKQNQIFDKEDKKKILQKFVERYKKYRKDWISSHESHYKNFDAITSAKIDMPSPLCVDIETASICDLACPHCFRDHIMTPDKIMKESLYKKIIDSISKQKVPSIKLNWRGEPLLNPKLYDFIKYAKSKGILEIIINTNATKLNSVNAKKLINSGIDEVVFSFDGGTKKTYDEIEHHTIKFGNKYKEHLDDIFNNKKLNNDISYYLHRPSATDKSMAPQGHDCFYVLVPVPNNQSKIDWSSEGEKMKNLVIDKMEKDLMPNLRENIVDDFYLTPDYFEKDLNTKHGSGFSIQPKFSQSAYFRFHNKSEIYDGLYFVGAGTHPGAGVPGVLSSAKVLDKIL